MSIRLYPPVKPLIITQPYGANPAYYRQFGLDGHEGIDYALSSGQVVFACADGIVKMVKPGMDSGWHNYGIHLRIAHADGYETIYAHLQTVLVREGQSVLAGDKIARGDNTGNSTGNHLHLTLKKDGIIIDPTPYIVALSPDPPPAMILPPGTRIIKVATDALRVRKSPSLKGEIVTTVPRNTRLYLGNQHEQADGWQWGKLIMPHPIILGGETVDLGGLWVALWEIVIGQRLVVFL
jgi:murein DD-endopeptidase MepM/ murein hydrolase activator NlpD